MTATSRAPLAGIRVLDLSRVIAAPYAAQMLSDLGAQVIKVERTGEGDMLRRTGPPFLQSRDGEDLAESSYTLASNRNKEGITANLSHPDGQAIVLALAAKSDILIENYKVGDLARFGLDYESVKAINPGIIYCSVTGYGQDGSDQPALDTLFQALSGLMALTGEPDGLPQRVGVTIGDLAGGLFGAFAIVAALADRMRGGPGRHIDMSLLDASFALTHHRTQQYLMSGVVPARLGSSVSEIPPAQAFRCRDGMLMIHAADEKRYAALCAVLEAPELGSDPKFATRVSRRDNRLELLARIEQKLADQTVDVWVDRLTRGGVMACPINDVAQATTNPDIVRREMVVEVDHPMAGRIPLIGSPIRMTDCPRPDYRAPPAIGEHTDTVLARELGFDAGKIAALREAGAI